MWFDPFCPKVIGLIEGNMPRTLIKPQKSVIVKVWPKKPEDPRDFLNDDDDMFVELRRKLARLNKPIMRHPCASISSCLIQQISTIGCR